MDEFQYAAKFLPGHPARCAVGAARRIGKVAVGIVLAVSGGEFEVQRQQRHRAAAQQKAVHAIRKIQQSLQAGDRGKRRQRRWSLAARDAAAHPPGSRTAQNLGEKTAGITQQQGAAYGGEQNFFGW